MLGTEIKGREVHRAAAERLTSPAPCRLVVTWIDWYAYHVARFRGLVNNPELSGGVVGLEMVGGVGVHAGLKFREELPSDLPIETLFPEGSWREMSPLRLAMALWRRLDGLDPEAVLVPGYYTLPGLAAAIWARVNRKKSILMTESTQADHARSWWKETLKAVLIRGLFDWAIAGGKAHISYLRELGFPGEKIARSYDVVDNDVFRNECADLRQRRPEEFGLPENYLLYIGRLAEEKNISGLLDSYLRYRQEGGTWPLVVVGDGPEAADLRRQAADSPFATSIHFAGHKGAAALPMYYAFAGAFVLPSKREPWGLVVNEAMASGLPVLVSDRCGCAQDLVLEGRNGFTFDPSSENELTQCLHLLESFVPERRRSMGQLSAERIQSYSPTSFGSEVARILRSRN